MPGARCRDHVGWLPSYTVPAAIAAVRIASLRDLRGREPAAVVGRALLRVPHADDRRRGQGRRRGLRGDVPPRALVAMIEDVFERDVAGRATRSRSRRSSVRSYSRGYTARPDALARGRAERFRARLLGHRRQGGRAAGSPTARRARASAAAGVHLPLSGARRHGRRLRRSRRSPQSGPRPTRTQGFTALKFDPLGRYSAFDPRQPSLEELDVAERYIAARSRRRRRPLRPAARHARAVHGGRRDPARAAARALRPALVRGARPARQPRGDGDGRACDVDPDRDGRAADHEVRVRARARRPAPRRSCSRISAASAGCSRRRRSRGWPRRSAPRSRPISTAAPWSARRTSSSRPAARTPWSLEGIRRWDGFHAEILRQPIEWEDGYVIPPIRAGSRRRAGRGRRGGDTRTTATSSI